MGEETFSFMKDMFEEFHAVFKDNYIHLGMDEVSYACWRSSPEIADFIKKKKKKNMKAADNVKDVDNKYMLWQDPVHNGVTLANDSVVIAWKDKNLEPRHE